MSVDGAWRQLMKCSDMSTVGSGADSSPTISFSLFAHAAPPIILAILATNARPVGESLTIHSQPSIDHGYRMR
jgi:hypothetical protein